MNSKKHYFVTMDTQDIREVSVPESGIEYEIVADASEIEIIKSIFEAEKRHTFAALQYVNRPFNESGTDQERVAYNANMMELYRRIFELGTEQTKQQIRALGILDNI